MLDIRLPKYGGPEVFQIRKSADLGRELADQDVLIEVSHSGINFADIMMRQGLYPDAPAKPFTPGYEFSGVVRAVGPHVKELKEGDRVMGGTLFGGYCSQIVLPSYQVRKLPEEWSLPQGAAFPVSFLTAYLAMNELARVRDGDRVYIDCATGALGQMCFQLLKQKNEIQLFGGTTSQNKTEWIKAKGATPVLLGHHSRDQYYDVILNSRGGSYLEKDYTHLASCGRMVMVGLSSAVAPGSRHWGKVFKVFGQTLLTMFRFPLWRLMNDNRAMMGLNVLKYLENNERAFELFQNIDLSKLNPPQVDSVFPAEDVGKAQEHIENKLAKGKVLLEWKRESKEDVHG